MKKSVLATSLSALLFAGSSSAVTPYDKDELKLHLNGDLQVQLFQKSGADNDLDVNYDDLDL
ncbi:MAG: hypothetical protein ACPGSC_14515 [Granulosicoccaceae bacterium]